MPICPKCDCDYEGPVCRCQQDKGGEPVHEAFLMTASDNFEATLVEARLREEGIPVMMRYKGTGSYLRLYMGKTSFGVDLYVPSDLLEKARDIVLNEPEGEDGDPALQEAEQSLQEAESEYQSQVESRGWMIFLFLFILFSAIAALAFLKP